MPNENIHAGITIRQNDKTVVLDFEELLAIPEIHQMCIDEGISFNKSNQHEAALALYVTNEKETLSAETLPYEKEYPAITVDGADENNNCLWLTQAELPNAQYPDMITSRLYAGYAQVETGEPIVFLRHKLHTDAQLKAAKRRLADDKKMLNKLVYVDMTIAQCRPWNMTGHMMIPEHLMEPKELNA